MQEEEEFSDTHFWYSSVDDLENEYMWGGKHEWDYMKKAIFAQLWRALKVSRLLRGRGWWIS